MGSELDERGCMSDDVPSDINSAEGAPGGSGSGDLGSGVGAHGGEAVQSLPPEGFGTVVDLQIEDELKDSYLTYAMSTIMDRALPDVRDGLKPSQRRILVAMNDLKLRPGRKHLKCAKICGDTSGNYHPHGESVIYPTMVGMAQSWKMSVPLVDPQGNFGSIDGDPPAAMRYTEARMHHAATDLLAWAGHKLGVALGAAINLRDIRKVVVGGGVSAAGDYILGPARDAMRRFVMPGLVDDLELVRETLGNEAAILGAARLAFEQAETNSRHVFEN